MLTVRDLARAVGKSETYVRQHIHRGHLTVQKDGRHTYVAPDEAIRWCRERGMPFTPPAGVTTTMSTSPRIARITIITLQGNDQSHTNVFTLIRHRRPESLGPWALHPSEQWTHEKLDHGFSRFTMDTTFERCCNLVDHITASGSVDIAGVNCRYDLLSPPRRHWAYRDHRGISDVSMQSPFSAHSAEILEHWTSDTDLRASLLATLDSLPSDWDRRTPFGFDLRTRIDRVGNLVVAGAQDAVTCDLVAHRNGSLWFHATGDELISGAYHATLWASHSGDNVLRQELAVTPGHVPIPMNSDADRIGFAVYRTADSQCIDLLDVNLLLSIQIGINVSSGPTVRLTDRRGRSIHSVASPTTRTKSVVSSDDPSRVEGTIRRRALERRAAESTAAAKRERNIVRFGPDEFNAAVNHLVNLLREADASETIYLADRYFPKPVKGPRGIQLFADLLGATVGRELCVLCTQPPNAHPNPWWSRFPTHMTTHLTVRSICNNGRPAFHDRYLITPQRETLFTHSLNGWARDGVTFATLPYGVYRAEAMHFWSLTPNAHTPPYDVKEYP